MTSRQTTRQPATAQEPIRKSVWILTAVIALGALVLVVVTVTSRPVRLDAKIVHASSTHQDGQQAPGLSEPLNVPSGRPLTSSAIVPVPSRAVNFAVTAQAKPEPSEKARELIKALSEIDFQPNELTPEKADRWKQNLTQLIEEGRGAVPVLEEVLEKNVDVRFDSNPNGNLLGEPTLRIALIKALFDIPTPDNVELQEKLLQTTTDPDEIALLARQLELQEPGEHYRSIIQAAKRSLQMADAGQLAGRDPKPLRKVLEQYGIPAGK